MKLKKVLCTGIMLAVMSGMTVGGVSAESEKVQIEFWDMAWGSTDYISAAEALVDEFNRTQDEIEVTYQSIPWDNFYQTFTTAIASGSAPDVSTGSGYQQHQFAVMGEILPLDDIVAAWEEEDKLDDFIDGSIEQFTWEDEQIAIPFNCDPRAIYYRTDIFEKAGLEVPTTYEELIETAKLLTTDDMYGFVCPGNSNGGYWAMLNFVFGEGGSIYKEDLTPNFDSVENRKAIEDLRELSESGAMPSGMASYSQEDTQKLYLQGKVAMIYSPASFASDLQESEYSECTGVMDVLADSNGEKKSVGGMNGIMAYKQSEHPEEAKTFLKWWVENWSALWTEGHLSSFATMNSVLTEDYFQGDKFVSQLVEKVIPYYVTSNQPIEHAFPAMAGLEGELLFADTLQMCLDSSYSEDEIVSTTNSRIEEITAAYTEE